MGMSLAKKSLRSGISSILHAACGFENEFAKPLRRAASRERFAGLDPYLACVRCANVRRDLAVFHDMENERMNQSSFDPKNHRWREVTVPDDQSSFKVRHDYTILGHDAASGTLDMVVRWVGDDGHCPIHRHVATTTVLVLEGEQHLWDVRPDGSRGAEKVRKAGDYHLSTGDKLPHLERGGSAGGLVFFGCHTKDGILYEILDENQKVVDETTIKSLVSDWQANATDPAWAQD